MQRVLFVCLGNICRSPTAEAAFRALVAARGLADRFHIDSAGTSANHLGEAAHPATRAEASRRGVAITHRARQVTHADFARFDCIVAMDRQNHRDLARLAHTDAERAKVTLLRRYEPGADHDDVPDPWYTGEFERVYDICARASEGLLAAMEEGSPAATRR
jgi:protein-tyrosine phosphatase